MHSRVQDDPSQTNSSLEFWIVNLRLGFGVLGLRLTIQRQSNLKIHVALLALAMFKGMHAMS